MFWFVWMALGAAAVVVAFFAWLVTVNWLDSRASARRREIAYDRNNAEASMQQVIEKTITRMFEATRGNFR